MHPVHFPWEFRPEQVSGMQREPEGMKPGEQESWISGSRHLPLFGVKLTSAHVKQSRESVEGITLISDVMADLIQVVLSSSTLMGFDDFLLM